MSTFKKIEKYEKIKKIIFVATVVLVVLDIIIGFISPVYRPSMTSLIGVGFAVYSLMNEYADYRVKNKKMSKMVLVLSLVLSGFSLYHIILNVISMSGSLL